MGLKHINECCNCAVPGYRCNGQHKRVKVPFCDECGADDETIYKYNGEDLCLSCVMNRLEAVR